MAIAEALDPVITLARLSQPRMPAARWYLFGSYLWSTIGAQDVDILVVHGPDDDVSNLRKFVANLRVLPPIDLYIMSECEEAEFDFILQQGAVQIFPLVGWTME